MTKIKLSVKEMKRISLILSKQINESKSIIENTEKKIFSTKDRKDFVRERQNEDLQFLETIKTKFDIETFGRNG